MGRTATSLSIGIALGPDRATAVATIGRARHTAVAPLALPADQEGATAALVAAFGSLASALGSSLGRAVVSPRVSVALLPPLADARLVALPPLRSGEAEAVIRRDAARHFLGDNGPRIFGVLSQAGRRTGGLPVLAATASANLGEAIRLACGASGWNLVSVAPAHTAWWARAAATRPSGSGRAPRVVVAVEGGAVHVLREEAGVVKALRRVPAAMLEELTAAVGPGPGWVVVFAGPAEREACAQAMARAGWRVADQAKSEDAAEAAAAGAAASRLELVLPRLAAVRHDRIRATARRAAVAALLLAAASAPLELWGTHRELNAIRARRADIRAEVAPLLAMRDSIARLTERADAIAALETGAPRWTRALFDLAVLLPRDTHLTTLRTAGDTLTVEATGGRASEALEALRRARNLEDVHLIGNVERVLQEGATASEQYRFSAVLSARARAAAASAANVSVAGTASARVAGRSQ